MSAPRSIESQTFFATTGLNTHRTGAATTDHAQQRVNDDLALRYLHRHNALDVAELLFAPPRDQSVTTSGVRT